MKTTNHGLSPDLVTHPGVVLADEIESRFMKQKELALRAGVSEAFLCDVIHGKKDISKGLAMGLEYALGISKSYWLDLQAHYDAECLRVQEVESIQDEERSVLLALREVREFLQTEGTLKKDATQDEVVLELRKLFRVTRLNVLERLAPPDAFHETSKEQVDACVLGAWLCICEHRAGSHSLSVEWKKEHMNDLITDLKKVMCDASRDPRKDLGDVLASYGIGLHLLRYFHGAPVHGYISRQENGSYQIILTLQSADADAFWFSLFHLLAHIANGDLPKPGKIMDMNRGFTDDKEKKADQFADNILLEPDSYKDFVSGHSWTYAAMEAYARSQGVPTFMVIGRLRREGILPENRFTKHIPKYRWASC